MQSIRTEFIRIGVVFGILMAIASWQFSFVVTAIGANPALNFVILGTFVFGLCLVGGLMRTLPNEFRALYSLFELYDDATNREETDAVDPNWRYYRCQELGVKFAPPKILGQSYTLIREQLTREGSLAISTGTMATLVSGIDQRLSEARSLISYIAATLIFLGLIGTFIGLMVTLASVGDILGSLDLSGSDPTETVAALMANLQTPLGGMATGFSSSLFGLVTSLTVSIMMQMLNRAGRTLRSEYSDWISNVVELSDAEGSGAGSDRATLMEERRLALLMKTARYTVQTQQRQARSLEALVENVDLLTQAQCATEREVRQVSDASRILAEQQRVLHRALARSIDAMTAMSTSHHLRDDVSELTTLMAAQLETRDSRLANALEDVHRAIADHTTSANTSTEDVAASALADELAEHADELNVGQLNKLLATVYRRGLDPEAEAPEDAPSVNEIPASGKG